MFFRLLGASNVDTFIVFFCKFNTYCKTDDFTKISSVRNVVVFFFFQENTKLFKYYCNFRIIYVLFRNANIFLGFGLHSTHIPFKSINFQFSNANITKLQRLDRRTVMSTNIFLRCVKMVEG